MTRPGSKKSEQRGERKASSVHTSDIIAQDPGRDDPSIGCEKSFQLLLRHRLRESTHVQVGSFDGFARRTRERDLRPDNVADRVTAGGKRGAQKENRSLINAPIFLHSVPTPQ